MPKSLDDYSKDDWLRANTHGAIKHQTVVHRLFRTRHMLADLQNQTNTLVNPCFETQDDDLENPLKATEFLLDDERYRLFASLMGEFYTQSWSLSPPAWGSFGSDEDTVRITSTVGAVFERLMDVEDPFLNLHYHAGLVEYRDHAAIRRQIDNSDFEDFLDSQGFGLLKTVLTIRADFFREREVRFVYIRSPRQNYTHPLRHAVLGDQRQFCAHVFDWVGALNSFEFNPSNRTAHPELTTRLSQMTV